MRKGRLYRAVQQVNENRTSICRCVYFTGNEVLFFVWYLRGKFFSNKLGAENSKKGLKFFHLS